MALSGYIRVRITSADIPGLLSAIYLSQIHIFQVISESELSVSLTVPRKTESDLDKIVIHRGDRMERISQNGAFWMIWSLGKRPVFLIGMILLIFMTAYIPSRTFFVRVEGNRYISEDIILSNAENLGLQFGASNRLIRSEKIKNDLMKAVPELQWVGVNTAGCVATIHVKERASDNSSRVSNVVSSIVAARDGVVKTVTVTRGNALCYSGKTVKSGDVLISGYTDCGLTIRAEQAEGEVYAETAYRLTVKMPAHTMKKGSRLSESKKYSILVGKKRINLYKGSGISGGSCDKMYKEYYIVLPGGFQLPLGIRVETVSEFVFSSADADREDVIAYMQQFARKYLLEQMLSGTVLSTVEEQDARQDSYFLHGYYTCLEMIGRTRTEEKIYYNGQDD